MLPLILVVAALVGWLPVASPGTSAAPAAAAPVATSAASTAVGPYMGGPMMMMSGCPGMFNPMLLGGSKGYPGLRARLNLRMFQYASKLARQLIGKQVPKARVPDLVQSTQPLIPGCVALYNNYVSRFRCPQMVSIFPKKPNHIVLSVSNMDVGITGNLAGNVLGFISVSGIAQINIHGLSVAVEIAIEKTPCGPRIKICSCSASVDYVDICIENGGLVGSIFNKFVRRSASEMAKNMIPDQLCKMLPEQLDKLVNSRAGAIPQAIALTQLAMFGSSAVSASPPRPNPEFCEKQCGVKMSEMATMGGATDTTAPVAPQIPQAAYGSNPGGSKAVSVRSALPPPFFQQPMQGPFPHPNAPQNMGPFIPHPGAMQDRIPPQMMMKPHLPFARQAVQQPQERSVLVQAVHTTTSRAEMSRAVGRSIPATRDFVPMVDAGTQFRNKRATGNFVPRVSGPNNATIALQSRTDVRRDISIPYRRSSPFKVVRTRGAAPAASSALKVVPPAGGSMAGSYMCSMCSMSADDPSAFIRDFAQNLNLMRLNDLFLGVQLMNTYATGMDFTIDLTGEFSPGGQGGTPFGAFPTMFPSQHDNHMAEAIISDYTINSLLYWMHKKGFLSFRIGPETPKIGELLKTTCSGEEEAEGSEVETDVEEAKKSKIKRHLHKFLALTRHKRATVVRTGEKEREKRQDDALGGLGGGSLSDLGICFGDILPAVKEKYPNKKIYIQIHTNRAPSAILSRMKGGSVMVDVCADADIYIEGDNILVGTVTAMVGVTVSGQLRGNKLFGMGEITNLKLMDKTGSLGLPQDALDNLGTLGKDLVTKLANDALMKGIPINVGQSRSIPLTFTNTQVMIIEHGIYVAGDVMISQSLIDRLNNMGSSGGC